MRQPLPFVGQSVGIDLTDGALPPNGGLSLALSRFLSGSTHTSASTAGTLWAMSSHIQTLFPSQQRHKQV